MPTIDGTLITSGTIDGSKLKSNANILNAALRQQTFQRIHIPFTSWRVWNAMETNLPGTSAADDLGLYGGTFGTASPTLQTYDVKTVGATNLYARAAIALPHNYDDGETVQLRFHAGMKTTVADTSCTLDVECYESDLEEGIGSDLCSTAATTINSLTLADIDFTITATALVAGDVLDVRINAAPNDGAGGTAVIGMIGNAELLCDTRG